MSETMEIRTGDDVAAYVRAVRAELADLPAEDVEDLTGGMEADLGELAAESGGPLVDRLGTPARYAAELRAAAGLPERSVTRAPQGRSVGEEIEHAKASFARLAADRPWLASTWEFLVTLRPAWWVLRAYVAAWCVWQVLGVAGAWYTPGRLLFVLAAVYVSVRLGRGLLADRPWFAPVLFGLNLLAAVLVLPSLSGYPVQYIESSPAPPGLSLDGAQVSNVYPYDAQGQRLSDVRLFDQDGRRVNLGSTDIIGSQGRFDSYGGRWDNTFPVPTQSGADPWTLPDTMNESSVDGTGQPRWTPPPSLPPLSASLTPTTGAPTGSPAASGTATGTVPTSPPSAPATVTGTATERATGTSTSTGTPTSGGR